MIGSIILLIVAIIMFVICLICAEDDSFLVFLGSLSFVVASLTAIDMFKDMSPVPTALDVYRGKTTLEITYRDSVAIDSTVIYKVK